MPWQVIFLYIIIEITVFCGLVCILPVKAEIVFILTNQIKLELHICLCGIKIRQIVKNNFTRKKKTKKKKKGKLPELKKIKGRLTTECRIGIGDAAETAVIAGGMYALWGIVTAAASNFVTVESSRANIQPLYNIKHLDLQVKCILKAKAGHIILAYIRYELSKIKRRG